MYNEKILNEFYNAKLADVIKGASGVGKITSDVASEIIKIYIKVEDKKIVDARFQTFGGVVAIAASSAATGYIIGKSVAEVKKFNQNILSELLGEVPENKAYVLSLVSACVLDAVLNFESKNS